MAFCKNCGSQLSDGAKFCPKCGQAAGTANNSVENNPQGNNESGVWDEIKKGWNEVKAEAAAVEEYNKAHPEEVKAKERKKMTKTLLVASILVLLIAMMIAAAMDVNSILFIAFISWIASIWYTIKVFKGKCDIDTAHKVSFALPALGLILLFASSSLETSDHKQQREKERIEKREKENAEKLRKEEAEKNAEEARKKQEVKESEQKAVKSKEEEIRDLGFREGKEFGYSDRGDHLREFVQMGSTMEAGLSNIKNVIAKVAYKEDHGYDVSDELLDIYSEGFIEGYKSVVLKK